MTFCRAVTWFFAILGIGFLLVLACGPCVARGEERSLRPLLDALWHVEASSRLHPPDGDDGRARGPLQIWRAYWIDAMKQAPDLGGTYADCDDRAYAEFVVVAYWTRYCPDAIENYDYRRLTVVHHLGPHPERLPKEAERYWAKVRANLKGKSSG